MVVQPALEWRGTTVQVCGLWPFSAGSSLPPVGTPLGPHLLSGATVCADPMAWFTAGITTVPSGFILARPAEGKSTLSRRMLIGQHHRGVIPMILADLKPDYVDLIRALGGEMIPVGEVRTSADGETTVGHINPLDLMGAWGPISELDPRVQAWALDKLLSQQGNVLRGLCEVANQGQPLTGEEASVMAAALHVLQVDQATGAPVPGPAPTIRDVLALFEADQPHPRLMMKVLAENVGNFRAVTRRLRLLLMALLADGQFGPVFDGPTRHLDLTRPGGFDVSSVDEEDSAKQAAVQLACWAYGVTSIALATKMADLGLAPRRHYMLVMDELWRLLRASEHLVYRIDKLTRLNRELGVGQIMITHTMDDLRLSTEKLTATAWGFVGRAAMVWLGGLVGGEFGNLQEVFALSRREQEFITDWAAEGGFDPATGRGTGPRGRGKFLLKLGKKPGIPFELLLTETERAVNDTNKRWADLAYRAPDPAGGAA
ncbi:hypothetical protein [Enemella evansiae]|uniref:hypothetical protein n=1 Tax=Enemella evansiae TaxID=2016499 RepID=UPI001140552B|nr:hypothetical protein [Enemella evansiae]